MPTNPRLQQGTVEWFEMVGVLMCEAASQSGLPSELNLSLVERYTDGVALSENLAQGLRFDIVRGRPSFRIGAQHGERADITIEITAAAARALNKLYSADPHYPAAVERFLGAGEMRVDGDLAQMGGWLGAVHDTIVERTA
ncbi:hypothetical protein ACXIVK_16760 [Paraburkholderia caledonica]